MTQQTSFRPNRRRFLQMLGAAALGTAGVVGYSRVLEPNWIDVERVSLPIPHLPDHLEGLHIAQMSDVHLSKFTPVEKVQSAVEIVNRLAPDLVVLTGDYVGDRADAAADLVAPLRALQAPIFAVYGNHDLWTNRRTVGRFLRESGVHLLVNEATEAAPALFVAGVDDLWSGRPDLRTALRDIPTDATTLLLVHEPDFFDRVIAAEAPIAVQFSGHSHGGQVRLPALGEDADTPGGMSRAPILPRYGRRYPIGLRRVHDRQIYTNRGLGVWPLPFRFNCRPEITLFQLQPQTKPIATGGSEPL